MKAAQSPLAGAVWVVIAMALFAGITALGRHLALAGIDPLQVLFFRNFFCVVLMVPLLVWRGSSLYRTNQLSLYGTRVAISFLSMMAMFQAVALIPIGEVTAIGFLSPIFATLFAILLLGERVRLRRWLALLVGLVGAMIILQPTAGAPPGLGQLFALVSAFAVGIIGPLVKKLTLTDDPDRVVFITNALLTPLSLIPALFVWAWPPLDLYPALLGLGATAVLGHMAFVRGYAATDASLVATYKFVRLPFAVLIGYLAFGETIALTTWVGGFIIFSAAAYITHREMRLQRRGSADQPGA
ncbi:MAG: DMT family transporter [Hyphomicrobiaceae bacterium]|nr:DMT family transporter [Hyphomicrobiaceae bacterium]